MEWKKVIAVAAIFFVGMCGLIAVDRECEKTTGEGGKIGLDIGRTEAGNVSLCFFGLEGEIPF